MEAETQIPECAIELLESIGALLDYCVTNRHRKKGTTLYTYSSASREYWDLGRAMRILRETLILEGALPRPDWWSDEYESLVKEEREDAGR